MIRALRIAALGVASALLTGAQCGSSDRTANAPAASSVATAHTAFSSPDHFIPWFVQPNPCVLLHGDRNVVDHLLGGVDSAWLAKSMSDTTPIPKEYDERLLHPACTYRLSPRPGVPQGSIFAWELLVDDALSFETGAREVDGVAKNMLDLIGAKTADGAQYNFRGWDYLGVYPHEMTGRLGHLAFHADWGGVAVSLDSVERFLAILRDTFPDMPIGAFGEGSVAEDDPCSLVTRQEAESILGTLVGPPYESRELSALWDKTGTGCSYFTKNHHVLSIRPWWSHGRVVFPVTGATRPIPNAGIINGEYTFDKEAADPVGNFYFLKGDQLLAVSWRTSNVDGDGALKFAAIAMKKLAK